MIRTSFIALILAASVSAAGADPLPLQSQWVPPKPKEGHSYPECFCTDSKGARVEVGQMACLTIGSREVLSRCEKARNLVIWRHQQDGCPSV